MQNILHNLKTNNHNLSVSDSVKLHKFGSNTKQTNYNGFTIHNIVPSESLSDMVNLIIIMAKQLEMYIIYYDNIEPKNASSECLIQINYINNKINLVETKNGRALIKEYSTNNDTCKDILNIITSGNDNIVYKLKSNGKEYEVNKTSIIYKIQQVLNKLSISNKHDNLVNLAKTVAHDPVIKNLAKTQANILKETAKNKLSQSEKGKTALGVINLFSELSENPLAQQMAAIAADAAKQKLSESEKGKQILKVANKTKQTHEYLYGKGGNYINFSNII